MDENKKQLPSQEDYLPDEPPLAEEIPMEMPELNIHQSLELPEDGQPPVLFPEEVPEETVILSPEALPEETVILSPEAMPEEPVILSPEAVPEETVILSPEAVPEEPVILSSEAAAEPESIPDEPEELVLTEEEIESFGEYTAELSVEEILAAVQAEEIAGWDAPQESSEDFPAPQAEPEAEAPRESHYHAPRKGRPKRKGGYGLFGLPHLAATLVWLAIIVMIGTSLGRMIWVCAADVLAFGRESKQVSVTITSNDTIDDIARKLHEAELIRYPEVFKLYAKLAVDEGDILPGTFQLDTIYDYHALVVQMGPRSSTRNVIEDVLIPEGLNCRQIFEMLEQKNICTVRELEEYAANGEFDDYWFLDGVERGDKYCLEGFLFPDTYDFYEHSTPREALGKMLLGFQARLNQEQTMSALAALNERLSGMMRAKGCSEEHIAEHQLSLRDLLIVASLIEEETASSKESPLIASVIFNRLTEDQMYERYLNIDAAIIYATGDANNIDTSIDHPYNTYKYAGLTPGPISNPGLDSINAALNFEDSEFYYYVLNPETDMHQFSKTLAEHEEWVEKFRGTGE